MSAGAGGQRREVETRGPAELDFDGLRPAVRIRGAASLFRQYEMQG
jgi:hypothetical protein